MFIKENLQTQMFEMLISAFVYTLRSGTVGQISRELLTNMTYHPCALQNRVLLPLCVLMWQTINSPDIVSSD